tara:strand:- start:85 stop:483 length:399 start_codon:yes stop_codon:yes gene_type:complete
MKDKENKLELNCIQYAIHGDIAEYVTTPKDYKYTIRAEVFNLEVLKKLAAFHDSLPGYGKDHMETHDITYSYIHNELFEDGTHPGLIMYEHGEEGCSQDNDCILIYTIDGVMRMTGIHACAFHEWIYKVIET